MMNLKDPLEISDLQDKACSKQVNASTNYKVNPFGYCDFLIDSVFLLKIFCERSTTNHQEKTLEEKEHTSKESVQFYTRNDENEKRTEC